MSTIILNIAQIVGMAPDGVSGPLKGTHMSSTHAMTNAWMIVDDDVILGYGPMQDFQEQIKLLLKKTGVALSNDTEILDAQGGFAIPSFCDSHTHIVYAGSREGEFVDRIMGLSYQEIAKRGGGIINSCMKLRSTSEEILYRQALERIEEVKEKGTGAIEIKSGYGLSTESELKILRVIKRLKEETDLIIRSTFLGAHAVPPEYIDDKQGYIDLICNEMLPQISDEELADFVDVFCDDGFFSVADTDKILEAASRYGLRPKIHADELALSGGTKVAIKHNAMSVDHLERIGSEEISLLSDSDTIPTVLPGASFFLRMPYAPARQLIDNGAGVAIASDYNPGSSPSGDMRWMGSLACINMGLTPIEALNALTINGAWAMGVGNEIGTIYQGCKANFFITAPMPSLDYFFYAYTTPLINHVFNNGIHLNLTL